MGLKKAHGIVRVEVEKAQCGPDIHITPINLGPPPPVDSTQPPRFNNIPMEDIDTSTTVGNARSEVASAARLLRKDRQPAATKILTGRGAPPRTKAIADALSGKQFQRSEPLTFPPCPPPGRERYLGIPPRCDQITTVGFQKYDVHWLLWLGHGHAVPHIAPQA